MRRKGMTLLACALLSVAAAGTGAQLAPYSQDFEGLNKEDTASLTNDGWLVFGNVFTAGGDFIFGYGPFPAPNDGAAFCAIDQDQGGEDQGLQQLSIYSDYNNAPAHSNGQLVEANTFQQQTVGAADVGNTWTFSFDAKRGNLDGGTSAIAFIKVLDEQFFFLTAFPFIEMTETPEEWTSYSIPLTIDEGLVDNIFQIGFANTATNFEPSAIFYDNINFALTCEGADNTAPTIEFMAGNLRRGAPVAMIVNTSDDDGYVGDVVAERAYINDCLIFDGATFGDGDGLLTDEVLELTAEEARGLLDECGIVGRPTSARFEADDCAGNTGVRTLRQKNRKLETRRQVQPASGDDSAVFIQRKF